MAITESRLKDGVLSLGTDPDDIDFSCQVTNARINTSLHRRRRLPGDAVR